MSSTNNSSSSGIGFVGLLAIVFITLKLTGHIDWSWWWVLSPVWISFAILTAVLVVAVSVLGGIALVDGLIKAKRKRRMMAPGNK